MPPSPPAPVSGKRFTLRVSNFGGVSLAPVNFDSPNQAAFIGRDEPGVIRRKHQAHRAIDPGEGDEFLRCAMRDEAADYQKSGVAALGLLKSFRRDRTGAVAQKPVREV